MQGFKLTFYTQQDRMHKGQTVGKWLISAAQALGLGGATLIGAAEGFGHDKKLRSSHFFELAEQPVEVTIALNAEEVDRFFAHIREENLNVFYVLTPIEYGMSMDCELPE